MPTIRIPSALIRETGGQRFIEVEGDTVRDALQSACAHFEGLRLLLDADGNLGHGFFVGLNDEQVSSGELVDPEDMIVIVAPISGGSRRR